MGRWHPARFDIPFAHGAQPGVEGCTRMLARRPHNSGPRCPRGASPMRPAHARPNVGAQSLGRMAARIAQHTPGVAGKLGLRNKQGPSPASCGRPRLHRTHRPCRVRTSPYFSSSTRCRPAPVPAALCSICALYLAALLYTISSGLLSYAAPFVSAIPKLRYLLVGAVSLQEPESHFMHACASAV
ncbi:hypothetical protein T440DRAFT_266624 [Plenodomus tracheiphilus IPT5]|uniref:Uncharacterized protein n=1 Tax=Plenodomus tracheiphilus IPT5 TaxID=1408161 RepID=A0A6A7BIV8_9PLEO|nr:hypothetical protein T440DRAFT_266624 [Plenodomus tracheiphilus IPT5]